MHQAETVHRIQVAAGGRWKQPLDGGLVAQLCLTPVCAVVVELANRELRHDVRCSFGVVFYGCFFGD